VLLALGVQTFLYPTRNCDRESFETPRKGKRTVTSGVTVA
jgi:hypothetical protein